jgi:hypothetical protein
MIYPRRTTSVLSPYSGKRTTCQSTGELPILQIGGIAHHLSLARGEMRWLRWRFRLAGHQGTRAEQRRLRRDYGTYSLCENDIDHTCYVGQSRNPEWEFVSISSGSNLTRMFFHRLGIIADQLCNLLNRGTDRLVIQDKGVSPVVRRHS